jgi:hypothetical protein
LFLKSKKDAFKSDGLVLFDQVQGAMQAEKTLKKSGYQVKLVAPPPELRRGCDLAVAINLVEKPGIERALNQRDVPYVEVRPLDIGTSEILEIVRVTDYGDWMMVRAANMKLTYEKKSGVIVNTSGGGCPDIPYTHAELIDRKVTESPHPRDIGFTLCALMLGRALDESRDIYEGREK